MYVGVTPSAILAALSDVGSAANRLGSDGASNVNKPLRWVGHDVLDLSPAADDFLVLRIDDVPARDERERVFHLVE